MADEKKARLVWTGENLDYHATLGSGYQFEMKGPAGPEGGSPMEFFLAGVAGCTAMDVAHVLRKRRQQVTGIEVEIAGKRAEKDPKVYTEASLLYIVRGHQVKPAAVERAIALSQEKYCSASIMLKRSGAKLHVDYRIEEA